MSEIHIEHHKPVHTHHAIQKRKGFWTVLKELFIDMIPVVIGILIALSFNSIKESWKEKKEEKYYLSRIKNDLEEDLKELKEDVINYEVRKKGVDYLKTYYDNPDKNLDSAIIYLNNLFGQTAPNVSNAAYLTLQSSGKFDIIENKKITEHLVILYSDAVKGLTNITTSFNEFKQHYFNDVVFSEFDFTQLKNAQILRKLLITLKIKNALNNLYFDEVISRYKKAIEKHQEIINEIAKEIN
jgi:hypothetical protein